MNGLPTEARLVFPDRKYWESYLEALREGYSDGGGAVIPEEEIERIRSDPDAYIRELNAPKDTPVILKDGTKSPRVPQHVLWLVTQDCFIGNANIRLALNECTQNIGGHIGYGIRPSFRRRGFGKKVLELALKYLKEYGLDQALLTCSASNTGSENVIRANGGVYQDTLENPYGYGLTKRFWVPVPD